MSRRQRINVPGGTYYVVQHSGAHHLVFPQTEDYAAIERLLTHALRRSGAVAHAYCWTPDAIHLVLTIGEVSIGRFMQGLTSRYARSVHRRDGESGHFFRTRYQAALIDPETYLLKLVHYVHHLPQLAGVEPDIDAYPYSSHRAYLGVVDTPWLNTRSALHTLDGEDDPRRAYRELMAGAPSPYDVELFRTSGAGDWRVIAGPEFLAALPRHARTYRSKVSLDQIIHMVTCAQGVPPEHVVSSSRRRDLALARALIAWFATERRIATLTEVGRRLNRDPSTLSVAISRYRETRPDLFKLNSLHYLTPVGPPEPGNAANESSLMKRVALG